MGDNAEFEKLTTLEARLAAALDRIAVGLGETQAGPAMDDPSLTSGAFEELQMRAESAEARVAELEAQVAALEAAQPADGTGPEAELATAQERIAELEAARDTDHEAAQGTIAARDAELEELRGALAAAQAQAQAAAGTDAGASDEVEALKAKLGELEGKVARLRAERAEAFAERDEARDIAEELQAASGVSPDDRMMALRAEAQELRVINERLTKNIGRLRGENGTEPGVLNKALLVELDALKAARASEAAELERILADLDRPGAGEGDHA